MCVMLCFLFIRVDAQKHYTQLVDPLIGTVGEGLACGYTFIGATYPFGMMQLTPSFFTPHKGIVVNQLSGVGCAHMGNFPVLPVVGRLKDSPDDMNGFAVYDRVNQLEAGYMSVQYAGINADAVTAQRSGVLRFTYPEKANEGTVIIGGGISSTFVTNAQMKITSPTTCEGYAEGGEFCGYQTDYRVYFAAEFNRPAQVCGSWIGKDLRNDRLVIGGKNSGLFFTFDMSSGRVVEYKVAISYVSVENAKENLRKDNGGRSFDQVKNDTQSVWDHYLGKIEVEGGSPDRIKQFYTHLYHSLIHPNIFSDVNGEYMGADYVVHKVEEGRTCYTTFSSWDTYRTQCQLLAMLFPKETSDMMQSLVDFAEQSGGYGRWILANIETGVMHGDPTPIIIANTYALGGRDFDIQTAYDYMKKGALVPGTYSQNVEVRPGLHTYITKGIENASLCLEYTSADYAIGQFALQAMGNRDDADFFMNRAKNWKNLYDPSTTWLRSRHNHDLSWKDPNHDWREATKENYFWMVPFDLPALIDTIGGKAAAKARLDSLFVRLDAGYDDHFYAAGNEPDFQVPWIYNWIDCPEETGRVISRIFHEAYHATPNGLPGNDDGGSMGAWYVFASVGLYPMIPGVAGFTVNAPQFERITMHLPEAPLTIEGGGADLWVRSLKVNGKKNKSMWIDWKDICKGGSLLYETKKLRR